MPGRPRRPVVSISMRQYAALLAVVLAIPGSAAAQAPAAPARAGAEAQPAPPPPPAADDASPALARIKRRLDAGAVAGATGSGWPAGGAAGDWAWAAAGLASATARSAACG